MTEPLKENKRTTEWDDRGKSDGINVALGIAPHVGARCVLQMWIIVSHRGFHTHDLSHPSASRRWGALPEEPPGFPGSQTWTRSRQKSISWHRTLLHRGKANHFGRFAGCVQKWTQSAIFNNSPGILALKRRVKNWGNQLLHQKQLIFPWLVIASKRAWAPIPEDNRSSRPSPF